MNTAQPGNAVAPTNGNPSTLINGSVSANAAFDGNVNIVGYVEIGNETSTTDPDTGVITYSQTGGKIKLIEIEFLTPLQKTTIDAIIDYFSTPTYVQQQVANLSSKLITFQFGYFPRIGRIVGK